MAFARATNSDSFAQLILTHNFDSMNKPLLIVPCYLRTETTTFILCYVCTGLISNILFRKNIEIKNTHAENFIMDNFWLMHHFYLSKKHFSVSLA